MRGYVCLDGEWYKILELEDSDCYSPGTRFVSLNLERMEDEEDET